MRSPFREHKTRTFHTRTDHLATPQSLISPLIPPLSSRRSHPAALNPPYWRLRAFARRAARASQSPSAASTGHPHLPALQPQALQPQALQPQALQPQALQPQPSIPPTLGPRRLRAFARRAGARLAKPLRRQYGAPVQPRTTLKITFNPSPSTPALQPHPSIPPVRGTRTTPRITLIPRALQPHPRSPAPIASPPESQP
ncbi:hypothetical protein F4781DRAFT_437628 [Annulohypoxylon bovei var. microspora]|nr:hypothetical protein F4781DRAFT_437628 [Annulohypoxylon bovei var. microspora]